MHITIFLHPATFAGTSCIIRDDINGAVPPGIYKPTASMGTTLFHTDKPVIGFIELEDLAN